MMYGNYAGKMLMKSAPQPHQTQTGRVEEADQRRVLVFSDTRRPDKHPPFPPLPSPLCCLLFCVLSISALPSHEVCVRAYTTRTDRGGAWWAKFFDYLFTEYTSSALSRPSTPNTPESAGITDIGHVPTNTCFDFDLRTSPTVRQALCPVPPTLAEVSQSVHQSQSPSSGSGVRAKRLR